MNPMLRVKFIVEGRSDHCFWKAVMRRAYSSISMKILVANTKQEMRRKADSFVKNSEIAGDHVIVFLVDQDKDDCAPATASSFSANVCGRDDVIIAVACRNLEAWLLADQEAMNVVWPRTKYKCPSNIECETDPWSLLKKQLRRHYQSDKVTLTKVDVASKLGECFDIAGAARRSRSLARFKAKLDAI